VGSAKLNRNVLCQSLFTINVLDKTIYLTKNWRKGEERKEELKWLKKERERRFEDKYIIL
jgi:hypothetical protein